MNKKCNSIWSSSVVSAIDICINSSATNYVKTCVAQYLFNPIYYCVDMSVGDCSYAFIWDNLKRR